MPDVIILLAVHNGARYLAAQLASIAAQQGVSWALVASDDGSTDASQMFLRAFAQNYPPGQVRLVQGPRRGVAENFRHLLRVANTSHAAIAFCDQDDVWLPDKLERALCALRGCGPDVAMYCGRSVICDDALLRQRLSPVLRKGLGFRNALVQNIAAGNSMVLNAAAGQLICAANTEAGPVVMHDWWIYQLVTAAGGAVLFDAIPGLLYRQHDANVVGANSGFRAQLRRFNRMLAGDYAAWLRENANALAASRHRFTPENQHVFDVFRSAVIAPLPERLIAVYRSGVYRQSYRSRVSFWIAAFLGRI